MHRNYLIIKSKLKRENYSKLHIQTTITILLHTLEKFRLFENGAQEFYNYSIHTHTPVHLYAPRDKKGEWSYIRRKKDQFTEQAEKHLKIIVTIWRKIFDEMEEREKRDNYKGKAIGTKLTFRSLHLIVECFNLEQLPLSSFFPPTHYKLSVWIVAFISAWENRSSWQSFSPTTTTKNEEKRKEREYYHN